MLREIERQFLHASLPWDVAPFSKGIARHVAEWLDIRAVKPDDYTHLLVVCGPFQARLFHTLRGGSGRLLPLHADRRQLDHD